MVHFLIHRLQFRCLLFQFPKLLLQRVQEVHRVPQWLYHRVTWLTHLLNLVPQFLHLPHLLNHLIPFSLPLLLKLFPLVWLLLPLNLLLLLFLNLHDLGIHFDEKMRKFAIDFIDQIGKVCGGFVVDALKEHDGREIFGKVLDFVVGELPLQNNNDVFFFCRFDFLC